MIRKPSLVEIAVLSLLATCGSLSSYTPYKRAIGIPDLSFQAALGEGFVGSVDTLALQSDNKIIVAGRLTAFKGEALGSIVRLNPDGTRDPTFIVGSGFDDSVSTVAIQEDDKLIIGGSFTSYQGVSVPRLARLNNDGSLDLSFSSALGNGFNASVNAVKIASDGSVFVAGQFSQFNNLNRGKLVKLTSSGNEDLSYSNSIGDGFNLGVNELALRSDGSLCTAGAFTQFKGQAANRLLCLNAQGQVLSEFLSLNLGGFNNSIRAMIVGGSSDNGLLLGGAFTRVAGQDHGYFSYINSDGRFDEMLSFNKMSSLSRSVLAIATDPENHIVVGGEFSSVETFPSAGLFRLIDGVFDTDFATTLGNGFNGYVHAVLVQPDGKILVGGEFSRLNSANLSSQASVGVRATGAAGLLRLE